MADQQELRPTSTEIEPRLCPNCGTPTTVFNELGVYWWYHCETCSWSQDEVIDAEPEDHEPMNDFELALANSEYGYARNDDGLNLD